MTSDNGDTFEVKVDFSQVEKYLKDLDNLEPKTRKKIIRSALRKANRDLLKSERDELKNLALPEGTRTKWNYIHTGQLKKGLTGKVRVNNKKMQAIVGVRHKLTGRRSYIKAPTYAGVWLNYGTRTHAIGKTSSLRRGHEQKGGSVHGIDGNDWVLRSYHKVEKNIIQNLQNDLETSYNETVKSKY